MSSTAAILVGAAAPALAAQGPGGLDGASFGAAWSLPFVGVVLSIALCPLLMPAFWQRHFGKVVAGWALAFVLPFGLVHGSGTTAFELARMAIDDYLPFLILLGTLFTIAGGILVTGHIHGSPRANVGLLLAGTLLASLIGNVGASMVMIRPLIRANQGRRHNAHVVIFFIFLVSNIGGSLTPLGNLPLFLGYLRGVGFFWPAAHLLAETSLAVSILLGVFYLIDRHFFQRDVDLPGGIDPTPGGGHFGIEGKVNMALLLLVAGAVLLSGFWRPGVSLPVGGGLAVELQNLARDALLLVCAALSLGLTSRKVRDRNEFAWGPLTEVGKLFAAIFVTIIPVIATLRAAREGAFAPLLALVSTADGMPVNAMYFWVAGLLSSFLDNAPTYLVFFNLAGGDAHQLMGPLGGTLAAISTGATFMGANSYIGNAPNFMVKAIAEDAGFRMPSFFGYMAWSGGILIPLFAVITFVFF